VSKRSFDYHQFLITLKLYVFETITTIVIILLLLDFAIKELYPIFEHIRHLFHTP
jgi:hypothetical protein